MTDIVTIRPAQVEDIEALVALLKDLFVIENDFNVDEAKQRKGLELMLANPRQRCVLVAQLQTQVVGMCTLQTLVSTAEGGYVGLLEDLIVNKAYRGQGIGQKLIAAIEAWAQNNGLLRLQLLADQSNQPALDFYQKSGWLQTGLIAFRKRLGLSL